MRWIDAATAVGVDFIGGFSALVHKGITPRRRGASSSPSPRRLAARRRVCASVNVATHPGGHQHGRRAAAWPRRAADIAPGDRRQGLHRLRQAGRLRQHGRGQPLHGRRRTRHRRARRVSSTSASPARAWCARSSTSIPQDADLTDASPRPSRRPPSRSRAWASWSRAKRPPGLGVHVGHRRPRRWPPRPPVGDSVAEIIEAMGVERCGAPGTTAALALLNDAVKKGGAMATSSIGGLSGAFIPVSEDAGMIRGRRGGRPVASRSSRR